jgi:hypothetical protein
VIFKRNIRDKRKSLSKTKEFTKVFKTTTLLAGALLALGTLAVTSHLVRAQEDPPPSPQAALAACDTDKDGTVDENEAKAAAGTLFNKLDTDKDGTLDEKELQGHMTRAHFDEADPDHDNTLTRNEYMVFVTKAFRAANRDGDSTIDARELETPAGRRLILLMQ